jgi:hypothetical protein
MVGTRPSRFRCLLALLVLLAAVLVPAVALAQSGRASMTPQEREQRAAEKAQQREELRATRQQERRERLAQQKRQRELSGGTRETEFGYVQITCTGVTWHYRNFPAGTHTITEVISIDGTHEAAHTFTFSGPEAVDFTPVERELSGTVVHRIDARAAWSRSINGIGARHEWDIPSSHVCGGQKQAPSFAVEKLQQIEGGNGLWVPTPLTGAVGQTIRYKITVTNNGNTPLSFGSGFSDPRCDAGTIVRGPQPDPVGELSSTVFTCGHKITTADQEAGAYRNVATVTGSTPDGGTQITETTNEVEVLVPKSAPGGPGTTSSPGTTTTGPGSIGVLATRSSSTSSAAIAATPSIGGVPRGCARSSFLVTVKAKGVARVIFYLDGHRLRALTAHSARNGTLSIRLYTGRLEVGLHSLKVTIMMAVTAASAKVRVSTRSLRFRLCAHAAASPRFTG